jgi:hypothetical protein
MFDVRFHYSEYCEEYFSGAFTVCEMTLIDVLEDHQALPVLTTVDVRSDDVTDALVLGLIGSVLEAPGVDLRIGDLRRDAYSGSDPDWYLLPQWVFFVDLPVSINGKVQMCNFQVRCRVKRMRDHGLLDGDGNIAVVIGDGVPGDKNLLSYYSGDILSAHHFDLLCDATSGLEESVWDLLLKGCSNEAEEHELRNGQALVKWFQNRAVALLGADKAGE